MEILNDREKLLVSELRKNGKKSILNIAKENKIPKSTMFVTLKHLEKNKVLEQKVLINFEKIGYGIKIFYLIKTNMKHRTNFRFYLIDKKNINSLYELGLGSDFLFEAIFKNFKEVHEFEKEFEKKFEILEKQIFNVIENVKIESFLNDKKDFKMEDKEE